MQDRELFLSVEDIKDLDEGKGKFTICIVNLPHVRQVALKKYCESQLDKKRD